MCRLFGMISSEATSAERYLVEVECSLLRQSNKDSKRLQSDGWGIGYYIDRSAYTVRSERPVYSDVDRYRSVVFQTRSRIIVAHIRKVSNPKGLPRDILLSITNSQPFSYGNILFAHNGTINIPDEVAQHLGKYRRMIKGVNDSEIYFWFLVRSLEGGERVPVALKNFEETLQKLWLEHSHKHPDKKRPYVGLNIVMSDGEKLYAYCRYSEEDDSSRSICFRDQPVFKMCYLRGNPLVVASEKMTKEDEWIFLESGQLLMAEVEGSTVRDRVERVM
ncbi:MAG: class II glutamine amidotransferase [Thermoproteota archaeon]